jgi:transposase
MCLYVRSLTTEETTHLAEWAQSYDAVTYRRARIIQCSAAGMKVPAIAHAVGCSTRWVRETILRVNRGGLDRIPRGKSPGRPRRCSHEQREALIEVLHQRPDTFGHARSQWTLADLAATARATGIVETISDSTVRTEIKRARRSWQRAKRWSSSPDPHYAQKRDDSSAG